MMPRKIKSQSKGKHKLITKEQASGLRKTAMKDPQKALKDLNATVMVNRGIKNARKFGFDIIRTSPKRRAPLPHTGSLDQEFTGKFERDKMIATIRDLFQNFSFAKGLLRQHIKNIFGKGPMLQCDTGDRGFDAEQEAWFEEWGLECDIRGVLPFSKYVKVAESSVVRDGDCGNILDRRRGKLQGIEGDRIANQPGHQNTVRMQHGVEMDAKGRPLFYHIWNRRRMRGSMRYARKVSAENFIHYLLAERYNQVRGIPEVASSGTDMQDLRETMETTKGTLKIQNMLAVAIESDAATMADNSIWGGLTEYDETDMEGNDESRFEVKIGEGVHSFELRPGEKAKTIQPSVPHQQFEPFVLFLIRLAAMPLGMPLEVALQYFTRGGYSAHRSALLQYYDNCIARREDIRLFLLDKIHRFALGWAFDNNVLSIPEKKSDAEDAKPIRPYRHLWQWPGLRLIDPDKERKADVNGYNLTVENIDSIAARDGRYWQDVVRQRIREIKFIEEESKAAGIDPALVLPQTRMPGQPPAGEEEAEGDTE